MHALLVVSALLFAAVLPRAQTPRSFALPTPPLDGTFANLASDKLVFGKIDDQLYAAGTLGGVATTIRVDANGTAFTGKAQFGKTDVPCSGALDGETLTVRIAEDEWRLWPQLALDDSLADLGNPEPDPERQWTVAVYLDGDNNLEPGAVADLLEMQRGVPAEGCRLVVLFDRRPDPEDGPDDWTDARELIVTPGDGTFDRLGPAVERDMGDPRTLASFVAGVFRKYPARHHAVFLWDHGGGWTGMCNDDNAPGHKEGTELSLAGLRSGLSSAMQASGVLKLDLVAFDACLMGQLDVVLAMHDLADAMVASEAIVPGSGYPYDKVLPHFTKDRDGAGIATAIVTSYGEFSDNNSKSGATMTAFDLSKAPAVAAALDALALDALKASDAQWQAIARALFYAENYEGREDRVANGAYAAIDLLDLTERLRPVPGIASAKIDAVAAAVRAMQLGTYGGFERTLSHGLAIYGPHRSGQYKDGYDQTPLGLGNDWRRLLRRVHTLADGDTSPMTIGEVRQVDALGNATTTAHPFGGERLLFPVTGESIVQVEADQWEYEPSAKAWILLRKELVIDPLWPGRWATAVAADMMDLMMPQYVPGENALFHELGGMNFVVTDGKDQVFTSLDMTTPSTQAPVIAVARFTEKATGDKQLVQVSFDRAEWFACGYLPIAKPGTAPRKVEPVAGDTFEFAQFKMDDAGNRSLGFAPALTIGDIGLVLLATPDDAGRYRTEFVARSVQGRTTTATHDYEVADNPAMAAWAESWKDFDPKRLLGTWKQFKVVGPQQYLDLNMTCEVTATKHDNVFAVLTTGGPHGDDFETHQFWNFQWAGLPSLRVVTRTADKHVFGWHGPVRVEEKDGKLFLAMKAINASGVVWEWRQQ